MTLPDFLIIGVPRAGTTALWTWLRSHPDVFMPSRKELEFFNKNYDKGIEWYEEKFAKAPPGAICGEATTSYIYSREAMSKMAQMLPNAKLIVSLRNPIDQLYSRYWHRRLADRESRSFEDAYPDLILGHADAYLSLLHRVCEFYPRQALKVVFYEDLMGAYHETCRFIRAREAPPPQPELRIGAFQQVRSSRIKRFADRTRRPEVPRAIRGFGRILRRANSTKRGYPPMDPAIRARLADSIDVGGLKTWLKVDLPPGWSELYDSSLKGGDATIS